MADNITDKTDTRVSKEEIDSPNNYDYEGAHYANKLVSEKKGGTKLLADPILGSAFIDLAKGSVRDTLTGLYNREYLNETLREIENKNESAAVMIIDIDNYKNLNDSYGHSFGDLVLRGLGRQLNELTRQERLNKDRVDIAARFGGDEFVVVFRNSRFTTDALRETSERIMKEIESRDYRISDESGSPSKTITVSVGCASRKSGETAALFFDRADKALYKAKQNGRKQVVLSD